MTARCLCTLSDLPAEGICARAARRLAGSRRRFPHRLDFTRADVLTYRALVAERMSISGVQDKVSLRLERGKLVRTDRDGEFILKPIPSARLPRLHDDVPANEHLMLQLAGQVFGIPTPPNTLVRFADGELGYLCRRFDRRPDGSKRRQEDFASLSSRSPESHGPTFKYDGSCEEIARLVARFCAAAEVEQEKLLRLTAFNYLIGNGDAHLKNHSVIETEFGDFVLTPAYDLISTSLHIPGESRLALDLFADDFTTDSFEQNGFHTGGDFLVLAGRLGLQARRVVRSLCDLLDHEQQVVGLVERSFLDARAQAEFLAIYRDRRKALSMGLPVTR